MFWESKANDTLGIDIIVLGTINICLSSKMTTEKASECGLVLPIATEYQRITGTTALKPVVLWWVLFLHFALEKSSK
ncbi:hypothetical protein TNCV_4867511 [Trichonephila clavipes]|nr:hypothetical protein TNCV_4867511 [Trichonephila clavipes]